MYDPAYLESLSLKELKHLHALHRLHPKMEEAIERQAQLRAVIRASAEQGFCGHCEDWAPLPRCHRCTREV